MNPGIYEVRILQRLSGHRNTRAYLTVMGKTETVLKQSFQSLLMNSGNFRTLVTSTAKSYYVAIKVMLTALMQRNF